MADETPEATKEDEPQSEGFAARLLEQAKKAKDQATAKAGEVKDHLASKAVELKDASLGKMHETLDDFNAALPIVREAGYALSGVEIQIGIPPKIVANFSTTDDVSAEKVEVLIAKHEDKKLAVLLLKALYQAWRVQMKIKIVGMVPKGLAVEIGLIPTVSVKFA